jgi:hypothetical protein
MHVRYLKVADLLREAYRFVMLENMVFRRIYGPKRGEATGV